MQIIASTPNYLFKRYGSEPGAVLLERRSDFAHIVRTGEAAETLVLQFEALARLAPDDEALASLFRGCQLREDVHR